MTATATVTATDYNDIGFVAAVASILAKQRLALFTKRPPLRVQQYASEHGVSADGCMSIQDVKDRVEMMHTIAKGWRSRSIMR